MPHRWLVIALVTISVIDAGLGLNAGWPAGSLYRSIESILFACLPMIIWFALVHALRHRSMAYKIALGFWLFVLVICAPTLIALRGNDFKGLLWLGIHFWWAVLGFVSLLLAIVFARNPGRPNP